MFFRLLFLQSLAVVERTRRWANIYKTSSIMEYATSRSSIKGLLHLNVFLQKSD